MENTTHKGVLKTWKDDRGFGFIQPDTGDKDVFVHISSLKGMARRPFRGDILYYDIAQDAGGKVKAVNVRIEGVETVTRSHKSGRRWFWIIGAALLLISAVLAAMAWPL
jgi:CspA family cold shock protein